nr:MBL fold metallo-hydrolase [Palleronia marisminoris]
MAHYGRHGTDWVLIDASVFGTMGKIVRAAEERFGKDACPSVTVLTRGHFDHVGVLKDLVELWDVPVYVELERSYLERQRLLPAARSECLGLRRHQHQVVRRDVGVLAPIFFQAAWFPLRRSHWTRRTGPVHRAR